MKNLLTILVASMLPLVGFAQNQEERIQHFNLKDNLAIQGYDPVAYFTQNEAVKGAAQFEARHDGVVYHFANEANKAMFLKNPASYEPQYGGWCAFAIGDYGKKVPVDPKTFKITDGKLYLFYNANLNNTLKSWNKNEETLRQQGDINWKKITFVNK
ncbi:MAG TPA: YHS domain-containing (seleno)protein [Saprospiraceae bacterium]|nr:YHS domain-containing (seleno)protein [Saprospiraceae bacterium]HMP12989.1 YHS domain-containing (seleno)protein [Saprospiraceae bacterium]